MIFFLERKKLAASPQEICNLSVKIFSINSYLIAAINIISAFFFYWCSLLVLCKGMPYHKIYTACINVHAGAFPLLTPVPGPWIYVIIAILLNLTSQFQRGRPVDYVHLTFR